LIYFSAFASEIEGKEQENGNPGSVKTEENAVLRATFTFWRYLRESTSWEYGISVGFAT